MYSLGKRYWCILWAVSTDVLFRQKVLVHSLGSEYWCTLQATGTGAFFGQWVLMYPSGSRYALILLSCCLTSTEVRWPIRDGDRVGRGRESERLGRRNRPKKTGETVDCRQNNGSVKVVSPRHCPATCAPCNCSFNCCAGQSH